MEEARKVIVVVAKVERGENKAMLNVQQMLYGNADKGGDRVDNGLKIETVEK